MNFLLSPIIIIFIIAISLIIIILIRSSYECKTYKIQHFFIKNTKNDAKLKIVFLTDFHNKVNAKFSTDLINDIVNTNPDIIILGGDFVDFSAFNSKFKKIYYRQTIKFFEELSYKFYKNINTKNYNLKRIIFSFGNHELRLRAKVDNPIYKHIFDEFKQVLDINNIMLLDDDSYRIDDAITISSLSLYEGYYYNIFSNKSNKKNISSDVINNIITNFNDNDYNIMLFHKPDYAEDFINYGYDLVLSGHNHGGLIKLPFIGAVFSPDFTFFPKYFDGLYNYKNKKIIVSTGIGEHFIKLRINNKPTMYVIDIN